MPTATAAEKTTAPFHGVGVRRAALSRARKRAWSALGTRRRQPHHFGTTAARRNGRRAVGGLTSRVARPLLKNGRAFRRDPQTPPRGLNRARPGLGHVANPLSHLPTMPATSPPRLEVPLRDGQFHRTSSQWAHRPPGKDAPVVGRTSPLPDDARSSPPLAASRDLWASTQRTRCDVSEGAEDVSQGGAGGASACAGRSGML